MKKMWSEGTIALFKIKNTDMIGLTPYTTQTYNMYDFPEEIELINKKNLPFIPNGKLVVNKDVVIGWIQANHRSVKEIVEYYIERIVQVDMVINTNLQTHKLPFIVGVSPEDHDKAQDILDRIINNEVGVFLDADNLNIIKTLSTTTPYIIDKLYNYRTSLENELLTYLGLDNNISNENRMLVDQINANNEMINANQNSLLSNLKNLFDTSNEVLGTNLSVEATVKPVISIYDNAISTREEINEEGN